MKPHQLRIEAFGPFATAVEIDFDTLSQEGLFLIHGRTGAGKTFLLDALCFALYGEVSGDRNLKGLKSDHAAPAAVPRVTLSFSCGGRRYRVSRTPAHTALRSRGAGTTDRPPQAVLERLVDRGAEPISGRSTEVTREVEGLVGLNAAQFRQVILLPQGRFAEVLRARAEEREALLKTLFDTVLFEQAGRWLEERARAERLLLLDQERALAVLRRQALQEWKGLAEPAPAPPGLGAIGADGDGDTAEPTPQDPQADGEPPADQEALDGLRLRIETVLTTCNTTLRQAGERLEAARRDKAARDDLAARWDRRAEALGRLEERESRQEVVNDYRQRLSRAEQAESLRASLAAEQLAREQLAALEAAVDDQLRCTSQARAAALVLPDSVLALDLSTLPDAEALAQAGNDLAARRVEVSALLRKATEAAQCRKGALQAAQRARVAGDRHCRADAARQRLHAERKAARETLQLARSARDQTEGLQLAARQAARIADAAQALAPAQTLLAACLTDQKRSEQDISQASDVLRELQRRQIEAMATRLAGALRPGTACPVCGSQEHPRPAEGGSPESLDQALAEAEQRLQAAQARSRTALSALTRADSQLQALREQAGSAEEEPGVARDRAEAATATLLAAQRAAANLEQLESTIQEGDRRDDQLQAELQAAATDQAVQTATADQETRRAELLDQEITAALGKGVDPRTVLDGIATLDPLLKAVQRSVEASGRSRSLLEQASERLARELAPTPFADGQAVRDALQQEDTRRRWAERIQAYERELLELRGLLASPDLVDLPEARPDTTAAQAALAQADGIRTRALTRQAQVGRGQRETARLCEEHRRGGEALERLRASAQLLNAVADRCQGRTAPFISLQRWVLSAYLGEICGHANRRLEQMTAGRYQLLLSDGGGRGGRQAGLSLRVLDAYTGEEREVNSLSGGETFQASLALALGVAETVEGQAGGLQLEALFIDEGFGTLDPDTLQLAMDELDRLREGGRMIGIISHVGALRERIRTGIEVLAGEQGSSLRVGRLHQL